MSAISFAILEQNSCLLEFWACPAAFTFKRFCTQGPGNQDKAYNLIRGGGPGYSFQASKCTHAARSAARPCSLSIAIPHANLKAISRITLCPLAKLQCESSIFCLLFAL